MSLTWETLRNVHSWPHTQIPHTLIGSPSGHRLPFAKSTQPSVHWNSMADFQISLRTRVRLPQAGQACAVHAGRGV